jgi:sulfide:quinone oxidoreductase
MAAIDSHRVLIAGGGVAGLEAAFALHALANARVDVEVIAPDSEFVYRPLAVVEPYRVGDIARFPLHTIVSATGARLRPGRMAAIDAHRQVLKTADGAELEYDSLLLALGAVPLEAIPGALTFGGPEDGPALSRLLGRVREGHARSIAFVVPEGASWPLPLYELALLTRMHVTGFGVSGVRLTIVTPEERPLSLFGAPATEAVGDLLSIQDIELRTRARAVQFANGRLTVEPDGLLEVDAVVALPVLEGPRLRGIPQDEDGFVPVDELCHVDGVDNVYAAGDLVQFPVKQGGIATQMADAAAGAIAVAAGAPVQPAPFRPVLRGLLLTGGLPRYLRGEGGGGEAAVDAEALWWPPAKIVGRYLAPFLAERVGIREPSSWTLDDEGIPVDVELELGRSGPRPIG